MSYYFWLLVSYCLRGILSLRYRVEVRGLEKLTPERLSRKGGILFLPNHPALLDPWVNFVWFWPKFKMRPLVIDYIYHMPELKYVHKAVGSIAIPNFETSVNEWKVKRAEKAVREIAAGLKRGENFLIYPSGRLKNSGKELLGGAAATYELLNECPHTNIVLVRLTGLWGSSFSRALLGRSPAIATVLWQGIKILFKNGLFFAPRRKLLLEIEVNPPDFPWENLTRITLNRYLERWYNRYPDQEGNVFESEPMTFVSYSCFRKVFPEVLQPKPRSPHSVEVSEETSHKIYQEIRKILDKPNLEIKPEHNLAFDLGMDSLNIAEFIAFLTKKFSLKELHPEDLETVGSILQIAEGEEVRPPRRAPVSFTWPKEKRRPLPVLPWGRTIPEAFLNICERMDGYCVAGDDLVGVLSYRRLKKAVLVLAQFFKTWPEERVAIMLPASSGAFIAILALQMAGKVPVMLNWTLGSRYLEEMMRLSGAKRILSSERFLDRVSNVQFGCCLEQIICLEEIRRNKLTLAMKLRGVWLSRCSPKKILKALALQEQKEDDPCVILFTSGTESLPKGVPLSHKNIILNQRSAMQCINTRGSDVIYAILPPFHSFGFSVVGLFPILSGIRVAFYPDPTDSYALAEGVERWQVTFFCSAPSFLKGLFQAAQPDQLKTIRFFVSGAEKAPPELFQRVAQLNTEGKLVEGYGLTECSPILTLNRPNLPPKGAGRLLPDVELRVIHPETQQPLPEGSEGEICVRGPNIFAGYLGNSRSPFLEIDGKSWFRTGDLGYLDAEGNLLLSGRLKRFTKIGGEMISLSGLEEVLVQALIAQKRIDPNCPSLAICASEKGEKAQIILFVTISLDKEEANQILQQAGFSNLVKIAQVKKIEEIPLLGVGKTDYRSLQALC